MVGISAWNFRGDLRYDFSPCQEQEYNNWWRLQQQMFQVDDEPRECQQFHHSTQWQMFQLKTFGKNVQILPYKFCGRITAKVTYLVFFVSLLDRNRPTMSWIYEVVDIFVLWIFDFGILSLCSLSHIRSEHFDFRNLNLRYNFQLWSNTNKHYLSHNPIPNLFWSFFVIPEGN